MNKTIKQNGIKSWILAARPKTLTGAAAPVIIGGAFSFEYILENGGEFSLLNFLLCLFFAFFMQIDANFINDYFDFKKGSDSKGERLGPPRACANGWTTLPAMKNAIIIVTALSALIGLPLAFAAGWGMIIIGILCIVFSFLYTVKFSYLGLGDILVLVFFGIIPVGFTFYIQTGHWTLPITLAAIAMGLATDCLLIVNNHRDRFQDKINNKKTLAVRFGGKFSITAYYTLGIIATALGIWAICIVKPIYCSLPLILYLVLHIITAMTISRLEGRELNKTLGKTALNIFIFGLLSGISILL